MVIYILFIDWNVVGDIDGVVVMIVKCIVVGNNVEVLWI